MTLSSANAIATQSLGSISSQIGVVSRNIAGVNTAGYSRKSALLSTAADGSPEIDGIRRATNLALFQNLIRSNGAQAQFSVIADGLARIDQFMNISSGTATDLSDNRSPAALISALSGALQKYSASPSNIIAAQEALSSAQLLASSLNDATALTQQIREQADSEIASSVADINSLLARFGEANKSIVAGAAAGADISDSLDKRDDILSELSKRVGITTISRANYDMAIYTDSGATLFETAPRMVSFAPSSPLTATTVANQVYGDGVQITGPAAAMSIRSGEIFGLTELRDNIAPLFQSQLDETARALISAFAEYDQTNPGATPSPGLFTYPGATLVPAPSIIAGLAGEIIVNANADPAQGGDITRLRDGGISYPGNPAYIYNTTGDAGFTARLLQLNAALFTSQTFDPAAGLNAQGSLMDFATDSLGWLSTREKQFSSSIAYQSALLNQATQALSDATGVNLDEQMSRMLDLENSYQASAKLLATVDSMYQALFNSLRA
jgi:flagellar hook-associated protein 1 FlgK